jgi:reactive intermediate/imine deaminase
MQHYVSPDALPPVTRYSQAIAFSGPMVVTSGQIPVDSDGNLIGKDDPLAQARQVFRNLTTALAAAGATMEQVVKLTVYMTDLADLEAFRQVRAEYIAIDKPPALALVQVSRLVNPDFKIEIDALAAT